MMKAEVLLYELTLGALAGARPSEDEEDAGFEGAREGGVGVHGWGGFGERWVVFFKIIEESDQLYLIPGGECWTFKLEKNIQPMLKWSRISLTPTSPTTFRSGPRIPVHQTADAQSMPNATPSPNLEKP